MVLRSSWLVEALIFGPWVLAAWFLLFRKDGTPGLVWLAVVWAGGTLIWHRQQRIALTAEGRPAPDRSVKPLSAPRSFLGIGRFDVVYPSELIEQRSARHRTEVTSSPPTV